MTSDDKPLNFDQARAKIAAAMNELLAGHRPGPITFRLKPAKKPGETYALILTPLQRESVIRCTRVKRKLKEKLKQAGEGTQIVGVTHNELKQLNDEIGEAAMYARGQDKTRLIAVLRRVADLFADDRGDES